MTGVLLKGHLISAEIAKKPWSLMGYFEHITFVSINQ